MSSYASTPRLSGVGDVGRDLRARNNETSHFKKLFPGICLALVVAFSYYVGTIVGFALTPKQEPISTFWPPNAVLLATFLLTARRKWWILVLAVLPVHLFIQLRLGIPIVTALGWFVGNISEALLGAYFIRRFCDPDSLFDRVQGLFIFLAFAVIGAPLITSFLDAAVVVVTGWGKGYWLLWTTRLFSNMLAELTLVPAIVILGTYGITQFRKITLIRYLEVLLLGFSVVVVSLFVFSWEGTARINIPTLFYLPLPLLLWAALRFGAAGLSASLCITTVISTFYAIHHRGPLMSTSMVESVLSLQVLLCMITLPLMLLAAVLAERKITEQSLRESRARLIDTQEQERSRIARELHDDVGQQLALVESELAQLKEESKIIAAKPRLDAIFSQVSEISKVTREISHGLHPSHLEHLGLMGALKRLCRDFGQDTSVNVDLIPAEIPEGLPFNVSLSFYRIAQEALHNVAKHSGAHNVEIKLRTRDRELYIRIADDGVGFTINSEQPDGSGISNMRERVASVGGTLTVISAPSEGTTIEASMPLSA